MTKEEPQVHAERIFVTAEMARRWLRQNIENNRPISEEYVAMYARDMKANNWLMNGDAIKFADTGELIDGQKRLTACVQCGIGFWTLVAYGIKREAFLTIDRNQPRSTGQVLHLASGVNDYNAVAAVLTWLYRFRDGIVVATRAPTAMEASELLNKHPKLGDSVHAARRVLHRFKAGPLSVIAICHYLFTRQDELLAEGFFDDLASGAGLRESDPVYRLRERIIGAQATSTRKIGSHEMIALYFKTWLAVREQRTFHMVIRWSQAETFPNIGPIDGKPRKTLVEERADKKATAKA